MTEYGTALSWVDDVDPTHRFVSGITLLGQSLYHRLITRRGALITDPDYGFDVLGMLHKGLTSREQAQLGAQIAAECRKDERVASVQVSVVQGDSTTWKISIVGTASTEEPFRVVMSVTDAATKLLEAA